LQPADAHEPRQDGVHRAAAQLGLLADLYAVELSLRVGEQRLQNQLRRDGHPRL
jgi:hypothetical protein